MSDLESRLAAGPQTPAELEAHQRQLAAIDALHTAYGFPAAFAAVLPDLLRAAATEGELYEKLDRVADECRELAEALKPTNFIEETTDDDLPI